MGRELKRVSLDFKWPMDMIWKGYINPYRSVTCKPCEGSGYSERARKYNEDWYALGDWNWQPNPYRPNERYNPNAHEYNLTQLEVDALVKEGRIPELCEGGHHPTPEDVREFLLRDSMGLDSISRYICLRATAEAEGWDITCPYCNGTGEHWFSEEIRKAHEDWRKEDPPTGDGYQLWTTTNEGAPISPVFATKEELAAWCVDGATIFGSTRLTCEGWMKEFSEEVIRYEIRPGLVAL